MYRSDSTQLSATHWRLVLEALHQSAWSFYITWVPSLSHFETTAILIRMLLEADVTTSLTLAQSQSCVLAVARRPIV